MSNSGSIEETIFIGARQLSRPEERAAFLENACGGDAALRERVERMLDAEQKADQFLAANPLQLDQSPASPAGGSEGIGSMIGRYKLLQQIGEGGCGIVYMAEQEQPIRRRVALKVIKPGMDSRQVIARFEAERQALAMMDHPNIARIYDAGMTGDSAKSEISNLKSQIHGGRPYFVMELVRGIRITDYCDQNNLPTRERLDLFTRVVQAVQHAHQKGIIHRDLKPSNVLITLHDGVPVPKVIDFGIAKALEQKLTDKTLFTQFEQFIGTPAYTSPEQAEMSGLDIDTRSDIYSLGVLLYELLVGKTPFDAQDLVHSGLDEMRRIIREKEPVRPSTRLSTMIQGEITTTAQRRRVSAPELIHLLKGDLDWVVMKCLEKDRTRRYETANGLASDIQRYLSNEPVTARPPSNLYRFSKLIRRNKLAFAAGAAVAMALVSGIVVSTWQAARARRAEQAAQSEKAAAQAVLKFFEDNVLAAGRPQGKEGGLGKDVTLRQAIDAAESQIAGAFKNQPLVEAEMRHTLGQSYRFLGEINLAVEQLERAFVLRRQSLGLEHPDTLKSMDKLGGAYFDAGQDHRAESLFEETLRLRTDTLGPDHPDTVESINDLASRFSRTNTVALFEESLKLMKVRLGPEHPDTLTTMMNLAGMYKSVGKLDQAMALFEETLKLMKATLGPTHLNTLRTMRDLASAYKSAKKFDQAVLLSEEALKLANATLGPEHRDTLDQMSTLAGIYKSAKKFDEATALSEEAVKLAKASLGSEHRDTLTKMTTLSGIYKSAGKLDQALALDEETFNLIKAKLSFDDPRTLDAMYNLGDTYLVSGKNAHALALLEELVKAERAKRGPDHSNTLQDMHALAFVYADARKFDEAIRLFEETIKLRKAKLGPEHSDTLGSMYELAKAYHWAGKTDRAIPLLEELFKIRKAKLGLERSDTLVTMNLLGLAYYETGKHGQAVPLLEEAIRLRKAKSGPEAPETLAIMHNLALAYGAGGNLEREQQMLEEVIKIKNATLGPQRSSTIGSMRMLAASYQFTEKFNLALPLFEEILALRKTKRGPEHPETLASMHELAEANYKARNLDQALPLARETLQLRKAKLGFDHSDTIETLLLLGRLLTESAQNDPSHGADDRERAAEGAQLLRDYLAKARTFYTNNAAKLERTLYELAELHFRRRQYAEAEPLYQELLRSKRSRLGAEHDEVIGTTASVGRVLAEWAWAERDSKSKIQNPKSKIAERAREAETLLRQCLAVRLRGTNTTEWRVGDVRSRLGGALVSVAVTDSALDAAAREAKLAEAEALLLEGNQRLQESKSAEKKYKRDALERLVRLYEAWGKPDKLSESQQKLAAFDKPKTAASPEQESRSSPLAAQP